MILDFNTLQPKAIYQTMIQCIVPRPIAWVLSDNGEGSYNLAPFSYFNGVSSKPPIISLSIGKKRDGSIKDTWANIEHREWFVVHIAHSKQAPEVSATAASLPFGESEVSANSLATVEEADWPLPRLEAARIAMLCRRFQIIEVGDTPQGLVLGQIEKLFVADDCVVDPTSQVAAIDASKVDPLARLGGDDYGSLGQTFTVERPA